MRGKNIKFDDKKIRKSTFYKNKKVNNIKGIDVKTLYQFLQKKYMVQKIKYFIGYNDNDIIRPLCIKLPQMTGYVRKFMKIQQCLLQ